MSNPDQLIKDADNIFKKFIHFGNRWEDALELYSKAANQYKIQKRWPEAANAYLKVAQCHIKLDSKHEAATTYTDAASAFKKAESMQECASAYQSAIELYLDKGRFTSAAKAHKELAEIFEAEGDSEAAIEHYQKAADFYSGENQQSTANSCMLKIGHLKANVEQYEDAVKAFEEVASRSVDNNLLKFSVKEYLFKACMCSLAAVREPEHLEEFKNKLDEYKEMDVNFPSSRECRMIDAVVAAYEARDVDAFTDAVREYDNISKLEQWKTTLLLKIKNNMTAVHLV